ncbi:hypothetical protein P9222_11910 [Paenibacillus amylolyticus]|nr:hypothetical protein [Paenibacillus amylolyticus]WFR64721.1 hypothetical protein P9222_11910 [Paenibacillus amylolyticus]
MMTYKDQSKSVEERVQHLLSLMTTEEKVGQLTQPFGWQTYTNDQGNITLNESFKQQVEKGALAPSTGRFVQIPGLALRWKMDYPPEKARRRSISFNVMR